MCVKLKVHKGDLVQMLTGKDRGKQGRVLEVRKDDRRVIVENLNIVKRHPRPKPMKDPSRMGAPQMIPGGMIEKAAAVSVSNVMVVCPVCNRPTRVGMTEKEAKGGSRPRARLQARATAAGDRPADGRPRKHPTRDRAPARRYRATTSPALKELYSRRASRHA